MASKYRVHKFEFDINNHYKLEEFLNSLNGDAISVIQNNTPVPETESDFVLIVEKRR